MEAVLLESIHFLQKGNGIEHHAVADDAAASFTQHATRNKLQHELLAADDDRVSGVMSAGIACDDVEVLREHIDDLALALISPLGADYDGCIAFFQRDTPRFANTHLLSIVEHENFEVRRATVSAKVCD